MSHHDNEDVVPNIPEKMSPSTKIKKTEIIIKIFAN